MDRVPRSACIWLAVAADLRARRRGAGRRGAPSSATASRRGSRRRSSTTSRSRRTSRHSRSRLRSRACSWCRRPRAQAPRSTNPARSSTREIARLAKDGPTAAELSGQDEARIQLHHRPGADRRLRRQGRPAQPVQHLLGDPAKFEWDIQRYRSVDGGGGHGRPSSGGSTPTSASVIRFHPERRSARQGRRVDRAGNPSRRRPAVPSRPRCRRRSSRTDCKSSSSSGTTSPRSRSPSPRERRRRRSRRKRGRRQPDDAGPSTGERRPGRRSQIEDELGDLGTASAGAAGREPSRLARCPEART